MAAEGCSGAWPAVTSTPVGGIFGIVCAALFLGDKFFEAEVSQLVVAG